MEFKEDINIFNSHHCMKKAEVNGKVFNYIISGSGEKKIVLLTAGSGLYEGYYKHIEALEKKYTVVAFDYPFGMKDVGELIDSIAQFLKNISFHKSYLIAESIGGLIGQLFIKKYPDMVEGLVLTNTGTVTNNIDYNVKKEVAEGIKSTIRTVQMTPTYILKSALIKKSLKKIKEDLSDIVNPSYAKEYVNYFMEKLTKEKVIYLCNIALTFIDNVSFTKEDFKDFQGNVYIISTEDDDTFDLRMNNELKTLFSKSICKKIKYGGHASFLFKFKEYIKILEEILN